MPGPLEPGGRRRALGRVLAAALATGVLGGCGIAGGTTSLGPTTTLAPVLAHLVIQPPEGPIGTVFSLTADGMVAGATIQFEITFPGEGHAYPGNALVVADDGTASTTYRATTANQPGVYAVRLMGPQGQLATSEFRVTDGKPVVPTSSTRPSGAGSRSTTTGKGASTTTTGRPSSTAPTTTTGRSTTTKPVATTLPPATTPTTSPPTTPAPTRT